MDTPRSKKSTQLPSKLFIGFVILLLPVAMIKKKLQESGAWRVKILLASIASIALCTYILFFMSDHTGYMYCLQCRAYHHYKLNTIFNNIFYNFEFWVVLAYSIASLIYFFIYQFKAKESSANPVPLFEYSLKLNNPTEEVVQEFWHATNENIRSILSSFFIPFTPPNRDYTQMIGKKICGTTIIGGFRQCITINQTEYGTTLLLQAEIDKVFSRKKPEDNKKDLEYTLLIFKKYMDMRFGKNPEEANFDPTKSPIRIEESNTII